LKRIGRIKLFLHFEKTCAVAGGFATPMIEQKTPFENQLAVEKYPVSV
jgi:hypothetical protein